MGGTGEMDDVLGRMAEGPRFADLWEAERRYAGVLQAWMNLRRRSLEHNAVVLEPGCRPARRFTEQLAARTGADAKAFDAKAALAVWTETANQQLLETQRSERVLADAGGHDPRDNGTAHGAAGIGRTFWQAVRLPDTDRTGRCASHRDRASAGTAGDAAGTEECRRRSCRSRASKQLAASPEAANASSHDPIQQQETGDPDVTQIGTSPATALSDAAKLGTKMLAGGQLLQSSARCGRADRDDAKGSRVEPGQGQSVPLSPIGGEARRRTRAHLLRPRRAMDDDGSAGRSLAGPQPVEPGSRPLCGGLGKSVASRPLPDAG